MIRKKEEFNLHNWELHIIIIYKFTKTLCFHIVIMQTQINTLSILVGSVSFSAQFKHWTCSSFTFFIITNHYDYSLLNDTTQATQVHLSLSWPRRRQFFPGNNAWGCKCSSWAPPLSPPLCLICTSFIYYIYKWWWWVCAQCCEHCMHCATDDALHRAHRQHLRQLIVSPFRPVVMLLKFISLFCPLLAGVAVKVASAAN